MKTGIAFALLTSMVFAGVTADVALAKKRRPATAPKVEAYALDRTGVALDYTDPIANPTGPAWNGHRFEAALSTKDIGVGVSATGYRLVVEAPLPAKSEPPHVHVHGGNVVEFRFTGYEYGSTRVLSERESKTWTAHLRDRSYSVRLPENVSSTPTSVSRMGNFYVVDLPYSR